MIKKILAVLAAIGGFFSAMFFVLMKQAKAEKNLAENECQQVQEKLEQEKKLHETENAVASSIKKQEAESEKLVQESKKGNNLNAFNAGIERLRKSAEKGEARNNCTGNCGT